DARPHRRHRSQGGRQGTGPVAAEVRVNRSEALTVDRIAGKIDRDNAKAARSARKADIEAKARQIAASFIALNDAERADFAKALIRECRVELMLCEGPVVAATFLQQQSAEAGKG